MITQIALKFRTVLQNTCVGFQILQLTVFSGTAPSVGRSFIVSGSRFVAFAGGMELLQGEGSANEP